MAEKESSTDGALSFIAAFVEAGHFGTAIAFGLLAFGFVGLSWSGGEPQPQQLFSEIGGIVLLVNGLGFLIWKLWNHF